MECNVLWFFCLIHREIALMEKSNIVDLNYKKIHHGYQGIGL